jgi:hypothetical protein
MRFARGDVRGHIVSHKKRPPPFVSALKRVAALGAAKNGRSRDFRSRSIFDFFNTIGAKLPLTGMSVLTVPVQPVCATQALNLSLGVQIASSPVLPQAFAKSAAQFETFVSVACFGAWVC